MAMGRIGVTFAVWALQGWYGSTLVTNKAAKGGDVFTAGANVVASRIFEMIQRVPHIDSANQQGKMLSDVKGELEFKDVHFAYPSRPGSLVLRRFSLAVKACQIVGLVGKSGSGKSTIVNLIERFHDPLTGEILLDGVNIKEFQLKWLRSQIGLEKATMEGIIRAAKAADAHNFISQLPDGYETLVGTLGIQMSEGQKQRISIARALLRDPRILLLDEATSALDLHSEKAVQDALNHVSEGRTTVVIAHRISALRNANLIAFIQEGQVVESGSHDQLMQKRNGLYSAMVQLQRTLIYKGASTSAAIEFNSSVAQDEGTDCIPETGDKLVAESSIQEKNIFQWQEDQKGSPSMWQLLRMTAPEWTSTLIGFIAALCYGLIQPMHSFCLGALLSVYFIDNHDEMRSQTKKYCFAFMSFAIFPLITNLIQHYSFGILGECLTKRVRDDLFGKIITFEMEWFDKENNSTGALCSRLATDATMVRTLVADRLSFFSQSISATTLAVILGMVLSWKLAAVSTAMQPLIIGSFYTKAITMRSMSRKILKAQNKSSDLASEAVGNHRIITAFYSQKKVLELYEITQMNPRKESRRQFWIAGFGLFISQFLTAANPALMFWYGGKLLSDGNVSYKHLFQTFFILTTTERVIAEAGSMTVDLTKGTAALNSIFIISNRKSKIDPDDVDGIKPEKINRDIELKHVDFYHLTRPRQIMLKDLSLRIDAGKVVSLLGQSGSGKSTTIRLIERFYDPWKGSVEVDGIDIKSYNLQALRSHIALVSQALRSHIALVSQEPTIFAGTIHDNIAYAKKNVTEAEIIEAATIANAHDFISSMKDGYATYRGERGTQLSGGQKQRIALARANLKNPAILPLDEATSELDINSQNLIQDALEKTMVGRTCLVVAHRLSTIQKSDNISVIDNGKIIEEGTHSELLAKGKKSAYCTLMKLQQLAAMRDYVVQIPGYTK
ncbi:ABC transporter family protein, putative [Theobroma cacao]|uniref:ABC transporter family protein, putative n=1 Tax=Theobroma cacao TaxID=3641 RepID=A0A061GRM4_THECC|nr:ABC transporter family protein, putative [Theobroma cacao]